MKDCPNIEKCPYSELYRSEESWKMLFCYGDSINGYESCERYQYKIKHKSAPPNNLQPDGEMMNK